MYLYGNGRLTRHAVTLLLLQTLWAVWPASAQSLRSSVGIAASREEKWRDDLRILASELPRRHKNLFFNITKEKFEKSVAELDALIPSLTDSEIKVALMRIVAQVGDSHTHVQWGYDDFTIFPLKVYRFSDGWYVTEADEQYRRIVGARLLSIGETGAERAGEALRAMIACENESCFKRYVPAYMVVPEILQSARLIPKTEEGRFVFADRQGRKFTVTLKADKSVEDVKWVDTYTVMGTQPPLYRRNPQSNYWFEYLAESRTLYLNYSRCRNIEGHSFKEMMAEALSIANSQPVERFVIDMRRNAGGDEGIFRPLIKQLSRRRELNRRGKLFVIVGRGTFSSACHNAIELKKRTNAIVVGEPTGQKPNSYGEVKTFKLPNSGLEINYSTWFWKRVEGDPPSFVPDIEVPFPSAAYLAGRDPFMDAVFAAATRR